MVEIELYQPKKYDVKVAFPSTWNELWLKELHIIADSLITGYSDIEARAFVFLNILKIRCGNKIPSIENRLDAEDCMLNGDPLVNFIYNENDLTKQPYPKLKLPGGQMMIGPANNFDKLTCGEFEDAEIFFNQFTDEPSNELLAKLAAVLYRPAAGIFSSAPVKYLTYKARTNEYITYCIDQVVPAFKELKAYELYTIYLWYSGCRAQMPKRFPDVFEGGTTAAGEADFLVFTKCIHAGAGAKNGSRSDIRRTLVNEYMFELNLEKIKADEMEAEYKRLNP